MSAVKTRFVQSFRPRVGNGKWRWHGNFTSLRAAKASARRCEASFPHNVQRIERITETREEVYTTKDVTR